MSAVWTRESVLAAFRAFHAKHGYQPVTKEATAFHGLPSWAVVKQLFGSWNGAIEACGWRPYPPRCSVKAKRMVFLDRRIQPVAEEAGKLKEGGGGSSA